MVLNESVCLERIVFGLLALSIYINVIFLKQARAQTQICWDIWKHIYMQVAFKLKYFFTHNVIYIAWQFSRNAKLVLVAIICLNNSWNTAKPI